ncbi:porin OmpA [Xenorhabdus innexi]|uniref:Outer membrane protein A n=1 Tax=Xenorhabdus innexi TaxID=290109 RepID=A0A1N6MW00_9GAMM|nr:porin OmpA [Xenorhabdus innexi]PHM37525.1 outer membrane protein A [Xenorhabdus innexi]SIP72992.1 Outer membrane protein A [Xenorhabdus innexi]
MKKTAIAVAVATFATVAQAAPKEHTWYAGTKVGWSHYSKTEFQDIPFAGASGSAKNKNPLGAGAYIGYQATPNVAFELGYDWLGKMSYESKSHDASFKSQGIQLGVKLSAPLTDSLDVYTRLGGLVWRANASAYYDDQKIPITVRGKQKNLEWNGRVKNNSTGISPLIAIGAEYALTKNIATRLDYQWVPKVGQSGGGLSVDSDRNSYIGPKPRNGLLTLGVSYRFGQDDDVAPVPVVPAPVPVVENRSFTLRSDVLFDFNKSTLKTEGKQELDNLYNQLSKIDPNQGHVLVLGYTDRIGSQHYNLPLSQKRAQSVADYLIEKGIPANSIQAEGRGKEDSVTGSTCDNVKARSKLIDCLSPDRRVIINIQGTQQVTTPAQVAL